MKYMAIKIDQYYDDIVAVHYLDTFDSKSDAEIYINKCEELLDQEDEEDDEDVDIFNVICFCMVEIPS